MPQISLTKLKNLQQIWDEDTHIDFRGFEKPDEDMDLTHQHCPI